MDDKLKEIIKLEGNFYKFSYKGYLCVVIRNPFDLVLLGYVGITKLSPELYKKNYAFFENSIKTHGSITFVGKKLDYWKLKNNKKTKFIGFDCGHYNDLKPKFEYITNKYYDCENIKTVFDYFKYNNQTYKTKSFVVQNLKEIVNQLEKII